MQDQRLVHTFLPSGVEENEVPRVRSRNLTYQRGEISEEIVGTIHITTKSIDLWDKEPIR